uniref:Uncharacterized protein n=1 Tax=Trichuris muris TaxID=70415 RepID=A0A5S6R682_TRIMR
MTGTGDVSVLVGMDLVAAHEQYQILKAPKGVKAPRTVETPIGYKRICRVRLSEEDQEVTSLVKNLWSIESFGIIIEMLIRRSSALMIKELWIFSKRLRESWSTVTNAECFGRQTSETSQIACRLPRFDSPV